MFSRSRWIAALVVSLVAVGGCAGVEEGGTSGIEKLDGGEREEVEMAPTVVSAGDEEAEVFNTKEVFEAAYDAFEEGDYETAIAKYEKIIEHAEASDYHRPALFNLGLAAERADRPERAAESYERLVEKYPKHDQSKDAYFRLAGVYRGMGRHEEAIRRLREVQLREGLSGYDRVEANVRRGELLVELDRIVDAENAFRSARNLNERFSEETGLGRGTAMDARSSLGLGRVLHAKMRRVPLELPVEQMTEQMERKMERLDRAHTAYLHAIRIHHPEWSVAAGFGVGKMFEDFTRDVYRAEYPSDFTDEQRKEYFSALHDRMRPMLERSVKVYERTLEFAEKLDSKAREDELVERTNQRLAEVRRLLDEPGRLAELADE